MNDSDNTHATPAEKAAAVLEVLRKLPEVCFTRSRVTGEVIGIKRGVAGYYRVETQATPEDLNGPYVTAAQIMAMESGSLFGWHVPAADPDYCQRLLDQREHQAAQSEPA